MESLLTSDTKIKVSSTLDKSVGKKYLTDDSPETCWTSQQGLPQYIQMGFATRVIPKRITLTFQGGFVGTQCAIEVLPPPSTTNGVVDKPEWRFMTRIYPEDVNRRQTFDLELSDLQEASESGIDGLKIVFEGSSDFFGRITVYDLKLEGTIIST